MIIACLCNDIGWTYEEYLDQPIWLIELIKMKTNLEAEYQKKVNRG